MRLLILLVSICLPNFVLCAEAPPSPPATWAETLHDALRLNSKPREKDAEMNAQKELTKSAKDGGLPTLSLNFNASDPYSDTTSAGTRSRSQTLNGDASASLNWTLFQCGMQYFTYKAAQESEKILKDEFDSTQFFITNTKGSVVQSSYNAYSSLISVNETLEMFPVMDEYLAALQPIAAQDSDAATAVEIARRQSVSSRTILEQSRESALDVFLHWVRLPPADNINNLQQAIDELNIPESWEAAYKIAIVQSPDVKQTMDQIRLAQYQIKIAEAAFCPRVSFSATVDVGRSEDMILHSPESATSASGGFSISVPIYNQPASDTVNYQKKMLIANRLSQQAALEDAQFSLQQTYKDLAFQGKNQSSAQSDFDTLLRKVKETENDIALHQHLPDPHTSGAVNSYISAKLQVISSFTQAASNLTNYKSSTLRDKFSVLQATGTLFGDDWINTAQPRLQRKQSTGKAPTRQRK